MSDPLDKSSLVAKVVDAIYGDTFTRPLKLRDEWPEKVKERMRQNHEVGRRYHREFALELYEKHMSEEQLQELLRFHTSELGRSIKETERRIHREMGEKFRQVERDRADGGSGGMRVITTTYRTDDDNDEK